MSHLTTVRLSLSWLRLNRERALANEAKHGKKTLCTIFCAHSICVWVLHSSRATTKQWLWQCLFSCDMYSVYTGYNCSSSVKFIPFGFQESASVCVLVKHNEWSWGDSLEETQNGNWQIELRFMWPGTARSTHGAELRTIRSFRDLSVHSVNVVARFMKQYDPLNGYAGSKLKASIWYFNHYTRYLIWNPVLSALITTNSFKYMFYLQYLTFL